MLEETQKEMTKEYYIAKMKELALYCDCICCRHYKILPVIIYGFLKIFLHAYCGVCCGCLISEEGFIHPGVKKHIESAQARKDSGVVLENKNVLKKVLGELAFLGLLVFIFISVHFFIKLFKYGFNYGFL